MASSCKTWESQESSWGEEQSFSFEPAIAEDCLRSNGSSWTSVHFHPVIVYIYIYRSGPDAVCSQIVMPIVAVLYAAAALLDLVPSFVTFYAMARRALSTHKEKKMYRRQFMLTYCCKLLFSKCLTYIARL